MVAEIARHDAIVIGGGVIGAAVAYGLTRRRLDVLVLDGDDDALRASRANFGLVWVQGKGLGRPEYAAWCRLASELWPDFAAELAALTGIDVRYARTGGVDLALSDAELRRSTDILAGIRREAGANRFVYEVLDRHELAKLLPGLGERVVGGTFCPMDGAANPLALLRALHDGLQRNGGSYLGGQEVEDIAAAGGAYRVTTRAGAAFDAERVVIAAGLGNKALAARVGLDVPVAPLWGQIIVTERAEPWCDIPTLRVRQLAEGSFLLGVSQLDVGFDTTTRADVMAQMAGYDVAAFPFLANLQIVRTWSGLRVMTPDGWPIYQQSSDCPGVFVVTGHSGVTNAANHAMQLAGWIADGAIPDDMRALSTERFRVPADQP